MVFASALKQCESAARKTTVRWRIDTAYQPIHTQV